MSKQSIALPTLKRPQPGPTTNQSRSSHKYKANPSDSDDDDNSGSSSVSRTSISFDNAPQRQAKPIVAAALAVPDEENTDEVLQAMLAKLRHTQSKLETMAEPFRQELRKFEDVTRQEAQRPVFRLTTRVENPQSEAYQREIAGLKQQYLKQRKIFWPETITELRNKMISQRVMAQADANTIRDIAEREERERHLAAAEKARHDVQRINMLERAAIDKEEGESREALAAARRDALEQAARDVWVEQERRRRADANAQHKEDTQRYVVQREREIRVRMTTNQQLEEFRQQQEDEIARLQAHIEYCECSVKRKIFDAQVYYTSKERSSSNAVFKSTLSPSLPGLPALTKVLQLSEQLSRVRTYTGNRNPLENGIGAVRSIVYSKTQKEDSKFDVLNCKAFAKVLRCLEMKQLDKYSPVYYEESAARDKVRSTLNLVVRADALEVQAAAVQVVQYPALSKLRLLSRALNVPFTPTRRPQGKLQMTTDSNRLPELLRHVDLLDHHIPMAERAAGSVRYLRHAGPLAAIESLCAVAAADGSAPTYAHTRQTAKTALGACLNLGVYSTVLKENVRGLVAVAKVHARSWEEPQRFRAEMRLCGLAKLATAAKEHPKWVRWKGVPTLMQAVEGKGKTKLLEYIQYYPATRAVLDLHSLTSHSSPWSRPPRTPLRWLGPLAALATPARSSVAEVVLPKFPAVSKLITTANRVIARAELRGSPPPLAAASGCTGIGTMRRVCELSDMRKQAIQAAEAPKWSMDGNIAITQHAMNEVVRGTLHPDNPVPPSSAPDDGGNTAVVRAKFLKRKKEASRKSIFSTANNFELEPDESRRLNCWLLTEDLSAAAVAHERVIAYSRFIGIEPHEDELLGWIAVKGLSSALPEPWKACMTNDGNVYYFNIESGESRWAHPNDNFFKNLVKQEKMKVNQYKLQDYRGLTLLTSALESTRLLADDSLTDFDYFNGLYSLIAVAIERGGLRKRSQAPEAGLTLSFGQGAAGALLPAPAPEPVLADAAAPRPPTQEGDGVGLEAAEEPREVIPNFSFIGKSYEFQPGMSFNSNINKLTDAYLNAYHGHFDDWEA